MRTCLLASWSGSNATERRRTTVLQTIGAECSTDGLRAPSWLPTASALEATVFLCSHKEQLRVSGQISAVEQGEGQATPDLSRRGMARALQRCSSERTRQNGGNDGTMRVD